MVGIPLYWDRHPRDRVARVDVALRYFELRLVVIVPDYARLSAGPNAFLGPSISPHAPSPQPVNVKVAAGDLSRIVRRVDRDRWGSLRPHPILVFHQLKSRVHA